VEGLELLGDQVGEGVYTSDTTKSDFGTSATWQRMQTKAAFSPGADILAPVRKPVYGFTA